MPSNLTRIWQLFTPAEHRRAGWIVFLMLLMAVLDMVAVLSILPFLTVLADPGVVRENSWIAAAYHRGGFAGEREFVAMLGIVSIAIVLVSSASRIATHHAVNRFVHLLQHSLSARLLSRYLMQPYAFFLGRSPSMLTKNVLSEAILVVSDMVQPLSQLVAQGVVVVAIGLVILAYDPVMAAWILVATSLLYGAIYGVTRNRLARLGKERQAANTERFRICSEAFLGVKEIKVTRTTGAYEAQFIGASRLYARHSAASDTLTQTPLFLVEAAGYSGLIVIALVLLARSDGLADVLPALGLYGFAAYRILPAAQIIYRGLARLRFSASVLESVHADLALPADAGGGDAPPMRVGNAIALRNVSYAYPSAPDKPILRQLDLVIPAKTTLAIVGRSGAGKSTLMDVILGLLTPDSGALVVDGEEITPRNVAAWQKSIGYVPQHIFLADTSVAENIALGVPRASIDMDAVFQAARAAQIHDFVAGELPQGYATNIGANGIRLSGGQRQRIGIARALYRDPPVLCFDEATSALDSETDVALNDAIRRLSGEKTVIVIAHRDESLRYCDMRFSVEDQP